MPHASHVRKARLANAKRLMVNLRGRPDSEHEMSFNRLALSVAFLACVLLLNPKPAEIP